MAISAALLLAAAAPVPETSLQIDIVGLRSQKGVVQLCLTREPKGFPDCTKDPGSIRRTLPASNPRIRLTGLAHGDYAISVIHDANGNAKLDTALGIPREGFGFSRNPAIGFGPPSFAAARFTIGDAAQTQQVRMKYLL
ncbi:DUF2141 domain-containing protein [Sphingomonas soli]|uniref:DUF2141 domain-containing protein n=1 Tax=Sphingomonas soli TaxID=266127 RepID=UPI000A9E3E99|nr:DUF2141 domain-containing protein [Sphingomonas soli]